VLSLEDLKDRLKEKSPGSRVKFVVLRYFFPHGWRRGVLYPKPDS
jgi:hypothetical protein